MIWRRQWHPLQYSCLENPMDGGAWWVAVHGVAEGWTWLSDFTFTFTFMHWRRKWQPLQCSCLENPRGGGAWWAAVSGVAQSRTRLKWLSSSRDDLNCMMWYIYTTEYYSAIKRNEIMPFAATWLDHVARDCHTEWSKSGRREMTWTLKRNDANEVTKK